MKKQKEKKKANKKDAIRYFLDTSIQIDKLLPGSIDKELQLMRSNSSFYSSFFSLYEFKIGLIANLIKLYNLARLYQPAEVIARWQKSFKIRELKYKEIADSVILQSAPFSNNREEYLGQLEAAIIFIARSFEAKGYIGSFGHDPIVKFEINSKEDFEPFLGLSREYKISQEKFWKENIESLKKLVTQESKFQSSLGLKSIFKHLKSVESDFLNSNKNNENKGLGDAIIAIECTKYLTLLTLDHSFEILGEILEKKVQKMESKYFS